MPSSVLHPPRVKAQLRPSSQSDWPSASLPPPVEAPIDSVFVTCPWRGAVPSEPGRRRRYTQLPQAPQGCPECPALGLGPATPGLPLPSPGSAFLARIKAFPGKPDQSLPDCVCVHVCVHTGYGVDTVGRATPAPHLYAPPPPLALSVGGAMATPCSLNTGVCAPIAQRHWAI